MFYVKKTGLKPDTCHDFTKITILRKKNILRRSLTKPKKGQ